MKLIKKLFGVIKLASLAMRAKKLSLKVGLFVSLTLFYSLPASAMVVGDWLTNLKTNFLVPLLEFLQFLPPIAGVVAGIMFIMGLMKYNKSEGREPTMKYLVICFFVAMIGLGFGAWMLMAQETGFGSGSSSEKITID